MLVNERWLAFQTEERIRDIQESEAHWRLVQEVRGTQPRRRFNFALPRFRWPVLRRAHRRRVRLTPEMECVGGR